MPTRLRAVVAALAVVGLWGCGQEGQGAVDTVQPQQAPPSIIGGGQVVDGKVTIGGRTFSVAGLEDSAVNWDAPLSDGITTDLASARQVGQLPFAVHQPRFPASPRRIQVEDPRIDEGRSVWFAYDFGRSAKLPTDGRVTVYERLATDADAAALRGMAAEDYPGDLEVTLIDVPGATLATLHTGSGLGRAIVIRDGLRFDISGPALTAEVALELAEQI
jgi:hypothetical protein